MLCAWLGPTVTSGPLYSVYLLQVYKMQSIAIVSIIKRSSISYLFTTSRSYSNVQHFIPNYPYLANCRPIMGSTCCMPYELVCTVKRFRNQCEFCTSCKCRQIKCCDLWRNELLPEKANARSLSPSLPVVVPASSFIRMCRQMTRDDEPHDVSDSGNL